MCINIHVLVSRPDICNRVSEDTPKGRHAKEIMQMNLQLLYETFDIAEKKLSRNFKLEDRIAYIMSHMADLKSEFASAKSEFADLEPEVADLKSQVSDLKSKPRDVI